MEEGLKIAAYQGHLHVIKLLMNSPNLTGQPPLNPQDNDVLILAGKNSHLPIIEYLLFSPEIKHSALLQADVHAQDNELLKNACRRGDL